MIDIREIDVLKVMPIAQPLLEEHYDEIALNKQVMKLKPNVVQYEYMQLAGMLVGLGAYEGDELVGYSVAILLPSHLHYADMKYAASDALFVRKSHRRGTLGVRLIKETERLAKKRGAQFITWHAKQGTPLCSLLAALGYGVQDIIYSKEL